MDCSEFVSRILYLDEITPTSTGMCTRDMKKFFNNSIEFELDSAPMEGDIMLWEGHVGIVS